MRIHIAAPLLAIAIGTALIETVSAVDPKSASLSSAVCEAPNRATGNTKDIRIHYVDINPQAKRTLLMVHGWPGLWHVWKYQIDEFKDDYRVLALNQRGFGGSEHPGDLETSSTMADLAEDLSCVLQHAKVSKAICVGHDWGTQVCYEAARMRPDLFDGVIGTAIPYLPYNGPFVPIGHLVSSLPRIAYNLFFQDQTSEAAKEMNRDVRRTLRGLLRDVESPVPDEFLTHTDSLMRGWDAVEVIPPIPFFTPEEEDYWVEQFETHGFDHTLGFYTKGTRYGSWSFAQAQGNHTIPQPVLSILPTNDPVADWEAVAALVKSTSFLPQLTTKTVDAAHWLMLEKPVEVNAFMREWLDQYYPLALKQAEEAHAKDEL